MVALIGLNSLFGKTSSLLLKLCPNIYNLRLYDEADTSTADDIRVIDTPCKVEAYQGKTKLNEAIKGSDIVLIGDDILSTPQTCFDVMAPKMQDYAKAIAESSPNALIIVAASPINKLVPVLSELLQENGYYDCNRVMGTTTSFNIRANCILASYVNTDPGKVFLPVVGGDSEETIVPLFSQAKPHFNISEAVMKRLIEDIKQASPLIYETKGSTEALSKAHATVKFLNSVIAGLRGEPNIMNIAFTKTTQVDGTEYFALPVLLGRFGIQARYGIPRILPFENDLIRESVFSLQKDTEFAKLFCKSRETAAETCSRNVANRYRKSKEFEQFVNGLKINKKGSAAEDKIADKLKPPIPVESGQLSGEKPFDQTAFYLRHKGVNPRKHRIIPAYMRTGESIMPAGLGYTFGNDNGIAQFVPKSSSAETLVCEPVLCPDKPNERELSFTNIVSLVENLVKKTTEKMINEKQKDESLKRALKDVENIKTSSEKGKNLKASPNKPEDLNGCLRKIDMLKVSSENIGNYKSSAEKVLNFSQKHKNNFYKNYGLIKNKSIPNKDGITFIGDRSTMPKGKININENIDDKINPRKRKYQEKNLESIFTPAVITLKESFEYKKGIRKHNHSTEFKQAETKQQNISINSEKHTDIDVVKHDIFNKTQRVFNYNSNHQSSRYPNKIVPVIKKSTSGENEICMNTVINKNILNKIDFKKTQDKLKDFNKGQNISIPESDLCKQILHNTSNDSEKNISSDDNKKNITTNNSGNAGREHLQPVQHYKIEQYNKSDSLESMKNEQLAPGITKLENNKYIGNKYKTFFEKRDYIYHKMYNENDPLLKIKGAKNMKNVLSGNLNSYMKRENMLHDKINKKTYELLVGRNSEGKNNRNIEDFKSLFRDKSCKDTKDFIKNKLRSKYSVNKSANNRLAKGEMNRKSQINKYKNISTNPESKPCEEVKSICYNAFSNEVTQINNATDNCDVQVSSALHSESEKNSRVPCTKEINLIPEPKHDKKSTDTLFQENQNNVLDSKDLNMLMKTLDRDVFKYIDKVCTNDNTNGEVKQINTTKNDSNLPEEQKPITDIIASNEDQITEVYNELIKSEIKEKVSPDLENSRTIHQNENSEPTEMTFEDVIKEIKLAIQPSNQENKSIDMSKQNKDEKSFPNAIKENIEITNLTKHHEDKKNKGSDPFPQSKEAILEKEYPISNNNMAHESIPEEKEPVKKQIDLNHVKTSTIYNILQNISKSSNKRKKILNKCQGKSNTPEKVPCSTNNPDYINKVSSNIPETFSSNKTRDSRSNKKTSLHGTDSVSYIKSLRKSLKSKENNKTQRKNTKQEDFKVSIKNLNDFEIPVKSVNTSNKNSIPLTPSSYHSKSFITSKYNSLISKRKNVSEMQGFFSGNLGQKLNEINKTEHSFSLRDKNGINNYFLLKGLLPKIKNNKHNLDNQSGNLSLLKTNVCNEDPFMSIKDKQKNKLNSANKKFVKPNLKKNYFYTSNDCSSQCGPLLITHNSVLNPNCPVHGFKHYLDLKDDQNKSISPTNKGNMSRINEAMLSNLCRMCNKVRNSEKTSSHQLNQKTHNFKLYSTSALPMKNKSPSCLCVEKRKIVKQIPMSKNDGTGTKLPKGFIKKQRITKILEKDLKKINPQKSSRCRNAETQAKEAKVFSERQTCNLKERNTALKTFHLHPQAMSRITKIDENFFNSRLDSSYIERYLKVPPKYIPHQELMYSKDDQKYRNSSKGRRVADIYKINWSDSQNNNQQTKKASMSIENDILVRGTCLEHVRNKFISNKATKHELSSHAYCDEQKTVVNSMEPSSLSNAFIQYTKDSVKCEYPTNQKHPSIRQLHKSVFRSS